jgi:hypothetical protein
MAFAAPSIALAAIERKCAVFAIALYASLDPLPSRAFACRERTLAGDDKLF